MEIIQNGKLFNENLRHPISAYYIQRGSDPSGFLEIAFMMFGF